MDLDKLNFLPEWNEDGMFRFGKGEEWKAEFTTAEAMYKQWREVFGLVYAFAENLPGDEQEGDDNLGASFTQKLIYENAMIIAPKIMGAVGVDSYVLKMENAAIIRTNARQLMEQVSVSVLLGFADDEHKKVIEEAMNLFREYFKEWVATFKRDEYEDEWGLFL